MADQLTAAYPDLRLLRIDIFALFDALETHFDYYGFTRIDLGALEDPQLADKSYQGPGKNYMFWDANHMTAKDHALAARIFLAALRSSAIRIDPQSDGFRLAFDSLQIGKTYHAQQSADLVHWEELVSFYALDTSQELAVVRSTPCCFYRLLSQ
jgi:phospholipase/lecithinase/hemolysin